MQIKETDYKWNGSLTKRSKTTKLVLHHAAAISCTADDIHAWHIANGWSGIGYHYFVRKNGDVFRGRPEDVIGAHAKGVNSVSIGVCFEGNYETEESMPAEQFNAGVELCRDIISRYELTVSDIAVHRDVNATACPGRYFPLDAMLKAIAETSSQPAPTENRVLKFQLAAIADGFKFPKYGADGMWGNECEAVAKNAIIKRRVTYKYKNLTKLVQAEVGVTVDGKCGKNTQAAIKAWQKKNNLAQDGDFGLNCWRKWAGV